jgi:hypothetical protein
MPREFITDDSVIRSQPTPEAAFDTPDDEAVGAIFGDDFPTEKPAETKPKRHTPREDTSEALTMAWMGMGTLLVQSERAVVGGRIMRLQSPLAGQQIDAVIQGTIVDRLLQPLVRTKGALEAFGSIIAAPIVGEMIARKPERLPMLGPILMSSLVDSLVAMGPMLKEEKEKQAEKVRAFAEISEAFGINPGDDPMEGLFNYIFGVKEEEENVEG